MQEVYPGIFLIREKGYISISVVKPPENVYVLAGKDGIIYDAGYGTKKALKYFLKEIKEIEVYYREQNKKFKITRILVSHGHPDHISGLTKLREALDLKVILTRKTANIIKDKSSFDKSYETDDYNDYLRIRGKIVHILRNFFRNFGSRLFYKRIYGISYLNDPDEIIEEKSDISINGEIWTIFPSPGHSSDHISLYSKEKGVLFSGDNVLSSITTWLGPPESNISEYIKTLKNLQNLPNLKLLLSAHGSPIEKPKERLSEILKHRELREQQVLNLIIQNSEKGISPDNIIKVLYPKSSKFMHQIARGWVVLTIQMLEEQGIITRIEKRKEITFFPSQINNK